MQQSPWRPGLTYGNHGKIHWLNKLESGILVLLFCLWCCHVVFICLYCREVYVELFRRWHWKRVALLAAAGRNFPQYNTFLKDLFLSRSVQVAYDHKIPRQATYDQVKKVRYFHW